MITYRLETPLGPLRALTDGLFRSGPPVILLHGWGLSPWAWGALMPPAMRRQRRWYALSLPGHLPDEAVAMPASLTTEQLAAALAQALEDLVGDEPVHLVGHSLGGFWGVCLAAYRPERLARLVLVAGSAQGSWAGALSRIQRLSRRRGGRLLFRIGYRWLTARPGRFRRLLVRLSGRPEAWAQEAGQVFFDSVYPDAKRYRPEVLLQLACEVARLDLTDHLSTMSLPVLLIAGARDPVVPLAQVHKMAARLPEVQVKVWPEVGHFPMVEAPEAVFALMESFLALESPSRI
ncbi:alpha/beta fold hydrolase [Rhodothermus profundi]|uniref:Pimeloyl-ACP methyl ester carboxylesterase n=1 Tax=Rhodothermus profundi TaxID=633813 RepID=A0A1M6XV83_9BACT|nr:alpha/beta hydrolase [Rhodothermus profundi]SHL09874.1 Pimeloyl-ACP methyl ester carboxylesterase [Rhodothermus profundi]